MILYLLKITLLMGLLLAVYHLLLGRERLHYFSRFYLVGSLLISLVAPLISIDASVTQIPTIESTPIEQLVKASSQTIQVEEAQPAAADRDSLSIMLLLIGAYLLGTVVLLLRLVLNIYSMYRMVNHNPKKAIEGATLVLLEGRMAPYSWWKYIFLQKGEYESGDVAPEIISHELTHIRQHHTYDILLVELLQVVLWFNPLVYLYKRVIKQNHEYLADQAVIAHHNNVHQYQHLLLDTIFRKNTPSLVSSINFSLTKKRLIMMTKKTSKGKMLTVKLAILPIVALTMFVFCVRYAEPVKAHSQNKKEKMEKLIIGKKTFEVSSDTLEMIKRLVYERSNVKFRTKGGDWHKPPYEELPDFEKRMCLVGLTTMKVNAPTGAQLAEWSNTSKFGLWIDGKHQKDNSILKNYKPSDFSHFFLSRLYKNAQHGINKGKQYQLDLTTNAGYEKDCREKEKNFQALLKQVRAAQK